MTDKLGNICGDVLNNVMEGDKTMEREKIIELVKALGITAEELGIAPTVKTVTEKDYEFIRRVKKLIDGFEIDAKDARDYFPEEYWDDLDIQEKKYKIVKCTMVKTIYKAIYVAMPEDEDEDYRADHYIGDTMNLDNDYPDDEEEWELSETSIEEENLTEEEVNAQGEDVWNYNDFAE